MTPQDEIRQLKDRVTQLEGIVKHFAYPSSYRFSRPVQGGPDGLKLGLATTDRLGFFGLTPVVRYDAVAFNSPASGSYGATEQNILNGLKNALLYYNLIHS